MERLKTVKEMYEITKTANKPLLSNFSGTFWAEYLGNFAYYDKVFRRLYLNFKYFIQDGDETVSEVQEDFTDAVYGVLLANSKKYSELYRIYTVLDSDYMLLDNYNITETKTTENEKHDSLQVGDRTDVVTNSEIDTVIGEQTIANKVSPYDTDHFLNNTESINGERRDKTEEFDVTSHIGDQNTTRIIGSEESYTLNKKGNIGVLTGTEMLDKHKRFWSKYEFYTAIFKDIAKELLLA